jgi:copper(I)-binding protein
MTFTHSKNCAQPFASHAVACSRRFFNGLCASIALTTLLSGASYAADFNAGALELNDLWIRASVPGQTNGAGYLQIINPGTTADKLIAVQSEAATRVELHTVINEDGVAKMRQVKGVDIPVHGDVKLAPGGYHVMFLQLTGPFKQGSLVPVVLKFEKAGEVRVNFTVKPSTYNPGNQGAPDSHGHGAGMKH